MTENASAEYVDVPVDQVHDSPFQPRKKYTGIDDLAGSMKSVGVLQPLLGRISPTNSDVIELVAGHRRIRGARKAGLTHVPMTIREMSDQEVKEAILIENGQREDVPPIEELAIYTGLREAGLEVEDIASRIGRPPGYVYRRLQLVRLCGDGKKALIAGELSLVVAELIARIKDKGVQKKAVELLKTTEWRGQATAQMAREWIHKNASLRLADADFDIGDGELVKGVPACGACPKNTSGTMLFPDLDEAVCTDWKCFGKKRDAAWEIAKTAAEEKGIVALEGEKAEKVFHSYGGLQSSWVNLDDSRWVDGSSKKLRTIIGKGRLADLQVFLARDRAGNRFEIVKRSALKKAMKKEPKKGDPREFSGAKSEHELAGERDGKVNKQFEHLVIVRVAQSIEKKKLDGGIYHWRAMAKGVLARAWSATISSAMKRRKLKPKADTRETNGEVLLAYIEGDRRGIPPFETSEHTRRVTGVKDLQALTMELLLLPELTVGRSAFFHECFGPGGFFEDVNIDELAKEAAEIVDQRETRKKDKTDAKPKKANGKPKPNPNGKKVEQKDVENLLALKAEGLSYAAIGEKVGLSKDQVARRIRGARK